MQSHNLIQGTPEWLAYRREHFNASDAPAMMGASPHKSRTALLRELHVGLSKEVGSYVEERIYAPGHKFEGASRGMAETILGQELYPVVGSLERLSASFDGLTMAEDISWEHKTLNSDLRKCFRDMEAIHPDKREHQAGRLLPLHHRIQMEQQLHISGAEKALFTASRWSDDGELLEAVHCWYFPDMQLRNEILTGWVQFSRDLASYSPTAAAEVIVPAAVTALPGVSVQVTGSIVVADNFKTFEVALREFIDKRLIRKPTTDQDFADLDQQIKALKAAEAALDGAEAQMVAQVKSIDDAKRIKDMLVKLARDNRLMAEKLLEARKTEIREEIVAAARRALHEHAAALASECAPAALNLAGVGDFAGAIKGKRTVQTLRESCDAELARARIALDNQARGIRANLVAFRELAAGREVLFADLGMLAHKQADDFGAAVRQRIADADAAHQRLIQQQREAEDRRVAELKAREEREAAARAIASATAAPAPIEQLRPDGNPYSKAVMHADEPAPTGILDRGESAAGKAIVNAMAPPPAPAPRADEPATLKLGTICERLAPVAITAAGLEALGIRHSATAGAARLYRESDFPRICAALVDHIHRTAARDWRVAA
jgi:predicted phage-related endonuclease